LSCNTRILCATMKNKTDKATKATYETVLLPAEIGRRIRQVRENSGLSQERLGEKAGLSRVSIVQIERGHRKQIKPEVIQRIAQALKQPPDAFIQMSRAALTDKDPLIEHDLPASLRIGWQRILTLTRPQQEQLGNIIQQIVNWDQTQTFHAAKRRPTK
jgi:transcriptional regulator with XRE-family HTH domain